MVQLGEELEVDEAILGNSVRGENDGLGEEISLKERAAFADGDAELNIVLNFFSNQASTGTGDHRVDLAAEVVDSGLEVDLDEIGERQEGFARGPGEEAVEREAVTLHAEGEAR